MKNDNRKTTTGAPTMRTRTLTVLLALGLATAGCDFDLDVVNPNNPTETEVLADAEGLIALAVGLQNQYADAVDEMIQAPALVTDEWGTRTRALICKQSLVTGGANFSNACSEAEAPWANAYRMIRTANTLLASVGGVGLDAGTETGIRALALAFRGMAYGMLYNHYEAAPIDITVPAPVPQPRGVVLDTAIAQLEAARAALAGVSDADLAVFRGRVLGTGLNLRTTIDARLARYYLWDGQFQQAIDAAQRVPLDVWSAFTYSSNDRNPVYNLSYLLLYVAPLASWALEAEAGDQRVEYWTEIADTTYLGNPDSLLTNLDQYDAPNAAFPLYIPDEMRLVQAEAHARLGNLARARDLINEVRTQASAPTPEPTAGLPALPQSALDTLDEVLRQIVYERKYELYNQGLRWEDWRRLRPYMAPGLVVTFEFMPIPQQECDANPAEVCVGG